MKAVILGNGPAGVIAAETLRAAAPQAEISLVGCEGEPPYSRMAIPYLLMGNIDEAGTHLRKDTGHFNQLRVQEISGKAVAVDTAGNHVKLDNGQQLAYDQLLICTGSHPLRPPIAGMDLPQVHTCWTLADARRISQSLQKGTRVLQIGAGFIGCIIMESLASRGVQLTVVEMGDRMVPRMMTAGAGKMIRQWVEQKGVRVLNSVKVDKLEKAADGSLLAQLSNGEKLACDQVIASAGVKPNIDFLQGSGVKMGQGIQVNERMQSNVANVYAAGDVAEALEFDTGQPLVNAIQPNAAEQARIAALNMAGHSTTSQGSLAINVLDTMGLISSSFGQWQGDANGGHGVERTDAEKMRYISLQFKANRLIGATAIGLTQHVGALRGLIQGRIPLGAWEQRLEENPLRFYEAYIAITQPVSLH